ncbi:MAG: alanine racemase, partial [Planctomycetes bacterium]|nr:alanine racemase [Planctomycetota bacterium]
MRTTLDQLQTPALLIHLDRVRHNIARTVELCGGVARWRPHVKTCKVPEVLTLLLDAGVRQFKVATTREAAVLLALAPEPIDVLVAMAHHGPNLQRVAALAEGAAQHRVAMLSEDPAHARQVVAAGLGVFVDLDPGWGRSGIPITEHDRIAAVQAAAGPSFRGLHCYEGHLVADDPAARQQAALPIYRELCALARSLGVDELVTSGTPGF